MKVIAWSDYTVCVLSILRACNSTHFTFLIPDSCTLKYTYELFNQNQSQLTASVGFAHVTRRHTSHEAVKCVSQRRQNALATGFTSSGAAGRVTIGSGKAMGLNDVGLGWPRSKVPKVPRCCSGSSSESGRSQAAGRDRRGGVSEPPRRSSREGGVMSTGERLMGERGGGVCTPSMAGEAPARR